MMDESVFPISPHQIQTTAEPQGREHRKLKGNTLRRKERKVLWVLIHGGSIKQKLRKLLNIFP